MSLSFGLNIKAKPKAAPSRPGPPLKKKSIFDDDEDNENDENDEDVPSQEAKVLEEEITTFDAAKTRPISNIPHSAPPRSKPKPSSVAHPAQPPKARRGRLDTTDLTSDRASARHMSAATALDASIYDYDAYHAAASTLSAARKATETQAARERKPKYIDGLLDAAARRKQDQLVAREKVLQRERETEGDEFADKDKFVTGAYKKQQEEARQVAEEEKRAREEEAARRKRAGGGMAGFYRGVLGEGERRHEEAMRAAAIMEQGGVAAEVSSNGGDQRGKTDLELAAEMRGKGVEVVVNEEGQITDKRQLLSAGLNVAPSGKSSTGGTTGGSDHLRTKRDATGAIKPQGNKFDQQRAQRERQTRLMEEQLEASAKRAADEEAEEKRKLEHAAKSRKTEADVSSARERYLARKREKDEAAKKAAG